MLFFCALGSCVVPHGVRGCCQRHFGAGSALGSWIWPRFGRGQERASPPCAALLAFLWDARWDLILGMLSPRQEWPRDSLHGLGTKGNLLMLPEALWYAEAHSVCLRLHEAHANEFPLIPVQAAPLSAFGFFPSVSKPPAWLPAPRKCYLCNSLQGKQQPAHQTKPQISTDFISVTWILHGSLWLFLEKGRFLQLHSKLDSRFFEVFSNLNGLVILSTGGKQGWPGRGGQKEIINPMYFSSGGKNLAVEHRVPP